MSKDRSRMPRKMPLEVIALETRNLLSLYFPKTSHVAAQRSTTPYPGYDRAEVLSDLKITDTSAHGYLSFDDWMAQAPTPPKMTAARTSAFYRAWATLWIDTEPAGGAWGHPIITPGNSYVRGIWEWDTGFHVLGLLHGGPQARQLAGYQIDVMLSGQDPSGKIPREIHQDGPKFIAQYGIQAPGILTMAANRLYETARSPQEKATLKGELAGWYDGFVRNHNWFLQNTDSGRGLYNWTGLDSGWDVSQRWDQPTKEALDLNCWMYNDDLELARMARTLGKTSEATAWQAQANALAERIRKYMWNSSIGAFNDTNSDGSVRTLITPVIAWPLWSGIASHLQAKTTQAHLNNPNELNTGAPLTVVSKSDPRYDPNAYCRGATWVNINWVAIQGLRREGLTIGANTLRNQTMDMVAGNKIFYEQYQAETGKGLFSPNYGWTSALYIDLAMMGTRAGSSARRWS